MHIKHKWTKWEVVVIKTTPSQVLQERTCVKCNKIERNWLGYP